MRHILQISALAVLTLACSSNNSENADAVSDADIMEVSDSSLDVLEDEITVNTISYRVMTYNVMCSMCDPSFDPWDQRLVYFEDIFTRYKPDLIGLQELMFPEEVQQVVAVAEATGHPFGALFYEGDEDYYPNPDATILYRLDRFDLIASGLYWLSPTPDLPWSKGLSEEQFLPRHVHWAHLKDRTAEQELLFITTHFDANHPAQENSAPLVLERTASWAAVMPVILTGDFNSEPDNGGYITLTTGVGGQGFHFDDAYVLCSDPRTAVNRDPPPPWDPKGRIDHIFLAGGNWSCSDWVVDLYLYGPRDLPPSDHWPVFANIHIQR